MGSLFERRSGETFYFCEEHFASGLLELLVALVGYLYHGVKIAANFLNILVTVVGFLNFCLRLVVGFLDLFMTVFYPKEKGFVFLEEVTDCDDLLLEGPVFIFQTVTRVFGKS